MNWISSPRLFIIYKLKLLLLIIAFCGNWIEIAYGTSSGAVRVIVHHPETVSSGPQLFQTFLVHRSSVNHIALSEKQLISGKLEFVNYLNGINFRELKKKFSVNIAMLHNFLHNDLLNISD